MVASEAHPFAKTGGLAEVLGALPDALARLGHRVTVVLPKYRGVECDAAGDAVTFSLGGRSQSVTFRAQWLPSGVTAVLIDAPELYDRDGLYGADGVDYPDNAWRFAVLSRAALEYARRAGERPSVIHAHDWQAGLVPVYQKLQFSTDPVVGGVPVICGIHNLAFQGVFPASTLSSIGVGWEAFDLQAMEYWGQISYLKGGINFSERITTVSPTYAREMLTPELGFGFDGVLSRRAGSLTGILNGIDFERWNPAADPMIPAPFSANALSGKRRAKEALLASLGLPAGGRARPLVGLISRLTSQKGMDLMEAAVDELMALDLTWAMLGSGDARYEDLWRRLAAAHPDRVAVTIGFDERLAHLIEAGADIFLMPSRFEPCGLNQMYSLRYGTVPVVRATGGLDDTVTDADENRGPATGFKFREYTAAALVSAVRRAAEAFGKPREWKKMQQAGMREDHSWNASAREYVKVYEGAVEAAAAK
ncbi:MAG: starch synthase [Acidobacteria bacterium RIFCSPLOWO2_02_FULL_67_36]|nr:MAG: starch synthase [Acidobacteria bacterium RIFCSPLOWO2_02_FULL_67_36]OFW25060.1 MAG: starch synthase [Acidobacteria bacterium RIFCSPLOWO2_12_FULL_66_21]